MSRNGRTRLVGKLEQREAQARAREARRLAEELKQEWRDSQAAECGLAEQAAGPKADRL